MSLLRPSDRPPLIVGLGGTTVHGSSTEQALAVAVASAGRIGAETRLFNGAALAELPHYSPSTQLAGQAQALVEAIRSCDGLIVASPGYHGTISGLVKNALDYVEETARDARVYLDGLPVGLIVTAYGWQATGSTLVAMRSIVHALRAWPTPLGAAINTSGGMFSGGVCNDPAVNQQLEMVGRQVVEFALRRSRDAVLAPD